jgi:hypothetical protein
MRPGFNDLECAHAPSRPSGSLLAGWIAVLIGDIGGILAHFVVLAALAVHVFMPVERRRTVQSPTTASSQGAGAFATRRAPPTGEAVDDEEAVASNGAQGGSSDVPDSGVRSRWPRAGARLGR